jgi:excisionase family DNA binding protein
VIHSLTPAALEALRQFVRAEIEDALRSNRDAKRWMTVREAAEYLGTTEVAIRRRIARKRIVSKRMGRSVLVDRVALDRELEKS